MQQLTSGALLDAVRGVHWHARRVTTSPFQGAHRSKRVGHSPEFTAYRPYQQGDDPSKIDWKLFGRTERVAIRLSHDESNLPTMVLVDASASMAYPVPSLAKWELAASVALGLCAVAHGGTDPVGIAVVNEAGVRALPARTRGGTVSNVLRMLLETTPGGSAPLAPSLAALRSSRRIAIVSDFLGDADELLEEAKVLVAAGREVYAVHIVATEELDPSALGPVVTDPEVPAIRRPLEERELAEYQESFTRWREELAASWRAAGAVYHMAITDEAPERVVRRVVAPNTTSDARA
jgi:uncharacterized protein (DUF58 family)